MYFRIRYSIKCFRELWRFSQRIITHVFVLLATIIFYINHNFITYCLIATQKTKKQLKPGTLPRNKTNLRFQVLVFAEMLGRSRWFIRLGRAFVACSHRFRMVSVVHVHWLQCCELCVVLSTWSTEGHYCAQWRTLDVFWK